MGQYSIKDLADLSGIKAHTIRAWEKRYGILEPWRTETNIRYYDDKQLRRVLNISTMLENGSRISSIAQMDDETINERIQQLLEHPLSGHDGALTVIHQMISAGSAFDEALFEKAFSTALLKYGIEDAYKMVFYPLLYRIGLMWQAKKIFPAQEHFLSNLLKQKFFSSIDALPPVRESEDRWGLFLPEDEDHELGLLMSYYMLKKRGKQAIYFGQNVPYQTLISAIEQNELTHLHFFLVRKRLASNNQALIDQMAEDLPDINCFVTMSEKNPSIRLPSNFTMANTIQDLID